MEKQLKTLKFGADSDVTYVVVDEVARQGLELKANKNNVYTKSEIDEKGFLTEHQDISTKADKSYVDSMLNGKQDKADYVEKTEMDANFVSVMSRLSVLEDKISDMKKTNVETTTDVTIANDVSVDYIIKNAEINASTTPLKTTINGKSVALEDSTIKDDIRLTVSASDGDVELKGIKLEGAFPKATSNAILSVKDADSIVIKDLVLDTTVGYNCLELGLTATTLAKNILIDNCKFYGPLSNNAILIFGTQDDCVININNCYFENVSNAIRLSNKTNAKNITLNITNCRCDKWESTLDYTGMILCQDYTSGSIEAETANNLFGDKKITINMINCEGPNGKIVAPEHISDVCGTKNEQQLIYVYANKSGLISYDENRFPILNIL